MLIFTTLTPKVFNAFIQFKTSSDSNKFFIFDNPIHWLAKINALKDKDLSPGIFIDLLNLSSLPFTKTENFFLIES